jgi:hypothetical protein
MTTEAPGQFLLAVLAKQRAIQEIEANKPETYPGERIVRLVGNGRVPLERLVACAPATLSAASGFDALKSPMES